MPQQQPPPPKSRKRQANLSRAGILALAAGCAVAAISAGPQTARAIVVPAAAASANPEPTSTDKTILPLSSSIFFVLDGEISSRGRAGALVPAHLRDPIVVNGVTAAAAGTPLQIRIVHAQGSQMGNVDGSVDVYFESLKLANGATLPLITPTAHIDPHFTAGQATTQGITDTVGDIFIPYHFLYHMLRNGKDVDLRPGTVLRARTAAELRAAGGLVAVVNPPPLAKPGDTPHPAFKIAPVETPPGFTPPTPKPSPSPKPT